MLPGVDATGIAYALFEPDAGFAEPVAATRHTSRPCAPPAARRCEGTPVDAIEVEGDRVRGVHAAGELLGCDNVVLAAGPWTLRLAAGVGLELPLEITREQDVIFETAPEPAIPAAVSSQIDRVYCGPRPRSALRTCSSAGGSRRSTSRSTRTTSTRWSTRRSSRTCSTGSPAASRVSPGCGGSAAASACTTSRRTGTRSSARSTALDGLFLATGGSGHCFKLGPAIGELVAGAVLGLQTGFADVRDFSLARFAEGREFRSTYGGNRA